MISDKTALKPFSCNVVESKEKCCQNKTVFVYVRCPWPRRDKLSKTGFLWNEVTDTLLLSLLKNVPHDPNEVDWESVAAKLSPLVSAQDCFKRFCFLISRKQKTFSDLEIISETDPSITESPSQFFSDDGIQIEDEKSVELKINRLSDLNKVPDQFHSPKSNLRCTTSSSVSLSLSPSLSPSPILSPNEFSSIDESTVLRALRDHPNLLDSPALPQDATSLKSVMTPQSVRPLNTVLTFNSTPLPLLPNPNKVETEETMPKSGSL